MIDQIVESALTRWEELWPGTPHPKDLRYILQSRRRVALFLFDAQKKRNQLVGVVKISRRAVENDRLERSVRLVNTVRKQLDGYVLETVPKVILLDPICGLSVSLEQGLPGDPMYLGHIPIVAIKWHRRNWHAWRQWLVAFQSQTLVDSTSINTRLVTEEIIPNLEHALAHDPGAHRIISDLQTIAKELEGLVINKVWRYGDAHHSNVLIRRSRVSGVVDWEGIDADHWPTSDWFQFTFQYLVDLYRINFPKESHNQLGMRAIDALLQPSDSSLTSMIQDQTHMFLASLGVRGSAMPAFLIAFLAQFHWPWGKGALLKHAQAVLCE